MDSPIETKSNNKVTEDHIQLNPASFLEFNLERNTQPKTVLKIKNISNEKILFKVKTTQPKWYYVRPNQRLLDLGETEEVSIVLVESECNQYLDQVGTSSENKLDKHRFLVQSKAVDDDFFERIKDMPSSARNDEFSKVWDGRKEDVQSNKLKVKFIIPSKHTETSNKQSTSGPNVSENVEYLKTNLANIELVGSNITANSSPEEIFTNLQSLKKKYDHLVEYTVHLTAERDSIVSKLEASQKELLKEKNKKKSSSESDAGQEKSLEALKAKKGFSFLFVLIVAILSILIGKYLS